MKKKYTRKQITESIAYWEKQLKSIRPLHESINGHFSCPHCKRSFDIIALYDNEDNDFGSNGPAMIECFRDRHDANEIRSILQKMNTEYMICEPDQLDSCVNALLEDGFVQCEEFGGDDWRIMYI